MENPKFFYSQYNKINWENQEKTRINTGIYNFIINNIIKKKAGSGIKIFDIGFGIGLFIKMINNKLASPYKSLILEGCEPSDKNYKSFIRKNFQFKNNVKLRTYNKTFLNTKTDTKFDFITAIYVFPHFLSKDLDKIVKKIRSMLNDGGQFILTVANEKYLNEKLKTKKDLFIENNIIHLGNKSYKEVLHYSDIPKIGKLIDYNREESFYPALFKKHRFKLKQKKNLNDGGFICTLFVFEK